MKKILISVAKQFSETPSGRYLTDGPFSGERFRDELLYPNLMKFDSVEIDLDGTLGYGSSFLEEAFGGLIREKKISLDVLKQKLHINSSRKLYQERIWNYIEDAAAQIKKS